MNTLSYVATDIEPFILFDDLVSNDDCTAVMLIPGVESTVVALQSC